MAAIDKLYLQSYYDYDILRTWAMAYYPELLFYFYDICLTYKDFEQAETDPKLYIPVMNTPIKVDKKLKWICPVPCIRDYLHNQRGVNPKWEWLYRIFWKGKKHF